MSHSQGMGGYGIAITKDGTYAYISMTLPRGVFKVRLADMTVESVVHLSASQVLEGASIALDASDQKVFVTAAITHQVLVIDTQTMAVVHTIPDASAGHLLRSQYGPILITWNGGPTVGLVNTDTYEVRYFTDPHEFFIQIRESDKSQDLWYLASGTGPGAARVNAGAYNHNTKKWIRKSELPAEASAGTVTDLEVLPNEQKAYVAVFDGWYQDYHAHGWLDSVDLASGKLKAVPIDGGAFPLKASPDSRRVFVGTGWPVPSTNNLLVVDTASDQVTSQVELGQTQYGWNYTQMNDLEVDPAHPGVLYATGGDANALVKVDMDSLTVMATQVFNQESLKPHLFVRQPGQATGYILAQHSRSAFVLNLDQATIERTVELSGIGFGAGGYDIAVADTGTLLVAQGETVLRVDPTSMRPLGSDSLPHDITGLWSFELSRDQASLYAIWPGPSSGGWPPDTFLRLDASTLQVSAYVPLEGGAFNSRPFELPDGSKLYALGGQQNGAVVVQVIDTKTNTVAKKITFDEPDLQGISAGPDYPFAYDSGSHTLFVGATQVVLAINTDTDTITKVIHLGDAAKAIGLDPGQLIYINAIGMVYSPREDYLYIAHLDGSFVSIYDLKKGKFLPQIIPLDGFAPQFMFANDDCSKIYVLNGRSDNVSVIDAASKTEAKVIDLHAYLP